jgi:ubiquinone/menaquinone biosynthesis C-methylase UbiE
VPALLERGRRRAEAEGFDNITFEVADAEDLPYANASFDIVLSTFGVMFTPDHERAANELMRVCKPGGGSAWRVGRRLASSGNSFASLPSTYHRSRGSFSSPVGYRCSPSAAVAAATAIEHTARMFAFRYRSREH